MADLVNVLLTTHDRVAVTDRFLRSLAAQETSATLRVFLVDSASPDGTAAFVRAQHPEVTVIDTSADVFWAQGMRLAFAAAQATPGDHVLWANDDTELEADAVERLLATHRRLAGDHGHDRIIVCGAFHDGAGRITYGGVRRRHRARLGFEIQPVDDAPQAATTMNGNLVLVPRSVVDEVGNLSAAFRHGIADFDYGLRARRAGAEVWVAPGFVGRCTHNARQGGWQDPTLPFAERVRKVRRPTGLPPKDWSVFLRRHAGPLWPVAWASPYVKLGLTSARQRLLRRGPTAPARPGGAA